MKQLSLVDILHYTFSFLLLYAVGRCLSAFFSICFISCPGAEVKATDHPRIALGSHIAAELREAIHCKLGLTGCAGIATNKLLAKLVSGTFKPNQQTSLLPENISDVMGCLSSLQKIPGTFFNSDLTYQNIYGSFLIF